MGVANDLEEPEFCEGPPAGLASDTSGSRMEVVQIPYPEAEEFQRAGNVGILHERRTAKNVNRPDSPPKVSIK
jgi:hypothetical protein